MEITLFTTHAADEAREIKLRYDFAPAYTNGETIWYGKAFSNWTLQEQVAVCAHEIMHIACRHVTRGKALRDRLGQAYDPVLFNIATDAIINETLTRAGHKLPEGVVSLAKLLTEVLGRPATDATWVLTQLDAETLYRMLADTRDANPVAAQALCQMGSGVFADLDGRGASNADALTDAEWATRLERALRAGQNAGRGIGAHAYQLGDLPKTKTPWEVVLRRLVTKAVTHHPQISFARPSRRWLALDADAQSRSRTQPAFQPGMINDKGLPSIAICLDVSGSISPDMLRRFGGEIMGIGKRTGAELHLIVFDHGIQLDVRLKDRDLATQLKALRFLGGGGTSFAEPIEAALARDPSIVVVLTDLCAGFGPDPKVPVVWASTRPGAPPFGRVVLLDN